MEIDDATFLVTGGSSGLGAACVEALLARGANVTIADVARPANREPAERVLFVPTDVTRESDVQAAIDTTRQTFGRLQGVVLCAGILHAELLVGRNGPASLDHFRRVVEVNLVGTFNAARLAAAAMSGNEPDDEGERGVIIMCSSAAAEDGQIGQAGYAASKGGVASMTLPLARELGRRGIRVVSVAPGAFETPMLQNAPEKTVQSLIGQTPYPARLGRPQEFAALVRHIFENRMLNGCVLRLDGALRMGPR